MKKGSKYCSKLDIIRILSCIAVLIYHLGYLKGGYLAVCIFFVLTGYLSVISSIKGERFSIKEYYLKRIRSIYIPLLLTVFITIGIVFLLKDFQWIQLKGEILSILGGYNNYWQLSNNSDYFASHLHSPFIHFWYIGILLQFEFIFPFVYKYLNHLKEKTSKLVPCIALSVLLIITTGYFIYVSYTKNIMFVYYHSLSRIYAIVFGLWLGFIHGYYGHLIPNILKGKIISNVIYVLYLVGMVVLFVTISSTSNYFMVSMLGVSIITLRIIDYATLDATRDLNVLEKLLKYIANLSYLIYLVQYPVIFMFQDIEMNSNLKIVIMILIIVLLSIIMNFALKKDESFKGLRKILLFVLVLLSFYGGFRFVTAKDYSSEMEELEEQLKANEEMLSKRQQEYEEKLRQEMADVDSVIEKYQNDEEALKEEVAKLPVVGIGDSVMLGAVPDLYEQFPNGYFDAKISRTAWVASGIIKDLSRRGILGSPIIINLGANGDCPDSCKREIMNLIGNREVFWLTVTNDKDVHVNSKLKEMESRYSNLHIIDWSNISRGHSDYFVADGIHLTNEGRKAYTNAIYDAIYHMYLDKLHAEKEEEIKTIEEEHRNRITFYGNEILLSIFDSIEQKYIDSKYVIDKDSDYETLYQELLSDKDSNYLNNQLVFIYDRFISEKQYQEIIHLCSSQKIYIVLFDEMLEQYRDDVVLIPFYQELDEHSEYYLSDGIHLSEEGKNALVKMIEESLKE